MWKMRNNMPDFDRYVEKALEWYPNFDKVNELEDAFIFSDTSYKQDGCVVVMKNTMECLTMSGYVMYKANHRFTETEVSSEHSSPCGGLITIDAKKVIETRFAESLGLDKYRLIMKTVRETDVSTNMNFQRLFNAFYRVRRNVGWRKSYYDLFENAKNENPSFEIIIRAMYDATGNVEASFSSKMLATINADMPIWDRYVLQNLGLKLDGKTKDEQLDSAIKLYEQIVQWYGCFLKTENAKTCITEFDNMLPGYAWISDVKKIDFYLWSIRP